MSLETFAAMETAKAMEQQEAERRREKEQKEEDKKLGEEGVEERERVKHSKDDDWRDDHPVHWPDFKGQLFMKKRKTVANYSICANVSSMLVCLFSQSTVAFASFLFSFCGTVQIDSQN